MIIFFNIYTAAEPWQYPRNLSQEQLKSSSAFSLNIFHSSSSQRNPTQIDLTIFQNPCEFSSEFWSSGFLSADVWLFRLQKQIAMMMMMITRSRTPTPIPAARLKKKNFLPQVGSKGSLNNTHKAHVPQVQDESENSLQMK